MPELPEVEHTRRFVERRARGYQLAAVHLPDPAAIRLRLSSRPADADPRGADRLRRWVGAVFGAPIRHGKRLGLPLLAPPEGRTAEPARSEPDERPAGLLVHLGMSGRFIAGPRPSHGRIGLELDGGPTLWLDDPRRFGCVVVVDDLRAALHAGLGPDALDAAPDGAALQAALASARTLKVGLLDQGRLAGIGNIQAVEALWHAGLHPATPPARVEPHGWDALAAGLSTTLRATIAHSERAGDEIIYVSRKKSSNPFLVYGRAGAPCPRCTTPLAQQRLDGRATVHCPSCQPIMAGG